MSKTKYITLEGGDGAGKTTLFNNLANFLKSKNKKVLLTKEFGSELDKACEKLREIALNSKYDIDEIAGQIIFAAIVKQHQEKVVKPAMNNKDVDIILSDRGIDSNFAYGPAHGISPKLIEQIFKPAYKDSVLPDLTIYLNIDPTLSSYRRTKREAEKFLDDGVDRVEQKGQGLQQKVRNNFLKIADKNPDRLVVIEVTAEKTPEDILNEVVKVLKQRKYI